MFTNFRDMASSPFSPLTSGHLVRHSEQWSDASSFDTSPSRRFTCRVKLALPSSIRIARGTRNDGRNRTLQVNRVSARGRSLAPGTSDHSLGHCPKDDRYRHKTVSHVISELTSRTLPPLSNTFFFSQTHPPACLRKRQDQARTILGLPKDKKIWKEYEIKSQGVGGR